MKTTFTIFLLVLALSCNISIVRAQVNVQDSLALVDLYNSTGGPNWHNHANWLTKSPVSTWAGIFVQNGRVTDINLAENNLNGSLPSSIGNLGKLEFLDIYLNELTGTIPSSMGNLENIIHIGMSGNQLTGSIPFSFNKLTNLRYLLLSANHLSGKIPSSINKLVNLENLYLAYNQFTGGIPFYIGTFKNLIELDLSYNQLTGGIPSSIGNLSHLENLVLSGNQLTGSIPFSIGKLINLTNLWLNDNKLSGSIPSSTGNLVNVGFLNLSNNRLSDSIPSSIGNLAYLQELQLQNNRLTGSIPSSVSKLPFLRYGLLDISHNYFTFDGMELIGHRFSKRNAIYDHQKRIPIHQNGNTLSVSAGGTLSNNTYKWYRFRKEGDTVVIKGDSVFHPTQNGKYLVRVKNSVATELTLYSDSILYIAPDEPVVTADKNELQQYDKSNSFRAYPNPAKDILHVETKGNAIFSLIDQSGKIYLTTNINSKGSINISNMSAGLYYLKNNSTNAVQKVVIAR